MDLMVSGRQVENRSMDRARISMSRGLPLGATEYDAAGLPPITGGCYRSLRAKRISAEVHAKRFRTVIEETYDAVEAVEQARQ